MAFTRALEATKSPAASGAGPDIIRFDADDAIDGGEGIDILIGDSADPSLATLANVVNVEIFLKSNDCCDFFDLVDAAKLEAAANLHFNDDGSEVRLDESEWRLVSTENGITTLAHSDPDMGLTIETPLAYEDGTLAFPGSYDDWADANNLGAWDAADEFGIPNVFRYVFNRPTGAFANPPLLSISFNANGNPVIHTPRVVFGEGFSLSILATDTLGGANPVSYPVVPTGKTEIPATAAPSRFFRLKAAEQ